MAKDKGSNYSVSTYCTVVFIHVDHALSARWLTSYADLDGPQSIIHTLSLDSSPTRPWSSLGESRGSLQLRELLVSLFPFTLLKAGF